MLAHITALEIGTLIGVYLLGVVSGIALTRLVWNRLTGRDR